MHVIVKPRPRNVGRRGTCDVLGLASATANLGKKQVNTERGVLVVEEALELGNLLAQHIRGVSDTANNTKTTSVRDGGSELGTSGDVHARKEDGMLDLEKISDGSSELLCSGHISAIEATL